MIIPPTWWGNCFTSWRSFGLHLALIFPKAIKARVNLVVFSPRWAVGNVFLAHWAMKWSICEQRLVRFMVRDTAHSAGHRGNITLAVCWAQKVETSNVLCLSCSCYSLFQVCVSASTSPQGWPVSIAWMVTTATLWLAHLVTVSLALAPTAAAVLRLYRQDRWSVPTALQDRQVRWTSDNVKRFLWHRTDNNELHVKNKMIIMFPQGSSKDWALWI